MLSSVVNSADLLLHPVRLRIVQTFLGDRALTTSQLSAELADIPPASLYRHVALLVDGAVLQVVAERRVRGAVERTYVLRLAAARVSPADLAAMSNEDYRQIFLTLTARLMADFDRYLDRGPADLIRDGVSFGAEALWLDDAEFAAMIQALYLILQPLRANGPRPGRKRRLLTSAFLPGDDPAATGSAPSANPGESEDE